MAFSAASSALSVASDWCNAHRAVIGIVGSLLTIFVAAIAWGRGALSWFRQRIWEPIAQAGTGIPGRTLIVQPGDRRMHIWADGQAGEDALIQIRVALHLTNVCRQPVLVSQVWLYFWRTRFTREKLEGNILIRHPEEQTFGRFPVLPFQMSEALADWIISPPFTRGKEPISVRIRVVDQFGNNSWTKRIEVHFAGDRSRFF